MLPDLALLVNPGDLPAAPRGSAAPIMSFCRFVLGESCCQQQARQPPVVRSSWKPSGCVPCWLSSMRPMSSGMHVWADKTDVPTDAMRPLLLLPVHMTRLSAVRCAMTSPSVTVLGSQPGNPTFAAGVHDQT